MIVKDTEKTEVTNNPLGQSPSSMFLDKSLASFSQVQDLAIKNSQAENIISTAGVKPAITKASRNNSSNTLMGLAKLQGFKGRPKK